jgi:hypothetical protein
LKLQGGLLVRGKGAGLVRREEGSEEEGTKICAHMETSQ